MDALPPSLPNTGPQQPVPAATAGLAILLAELTEALAKLPPNTSIDAQVLRLLSQPPPSVVPDPAAAKTPLGMLIQITTPDGTAQIRLPPQIQVAPGAKLDITVIQGGAQPQWRLLAIDDKPVGPNGVIATPAATGAPAPASTSPLTQIQPDSRPPPSPGIPATIVTSSDPSLPSGTTLMVRIVNLVPPQQQPSPVPVQGQAQAPTAATTASAPQPGPQPAAAGEEPPAPSPTAAPAPLPAAVAAPQPAAAPAVPAAEAAQPETSPNSAAVPAVTAPAPAPTPPTGAPPSTITVAAQTQAPAPPSPAPAAAAQQLPATPAATAAPAQLPQTPPAASAPATVPTPASQPPAPSPTVQAPPPSVAAAPAPLPAPSVANPATPSPIPFPAAAPNPAPAPPPPPQEVSGQVLPNTDAGRQLIRTPIGLLALDGGPQTLPADSGVTLQLVGKPVPPPAFQPQQPIPDDPPDRAVPHRLAHLIDTVQTSNGSLADAIRDKIPAPGPKLAAQILSVVASAQAQAPSLARFLGESMVTALTHAAPQALEALARHWESPAPAVQGPGEGDWRSLVIPFLMGGQMTTIRLTARHRQGRMSAAEREKGTRFLLDLDLSRLGPMQFDGLVKRQYKRFDLIIRTTSPLPGEMRRDIDALFINGLLNFGLEGSVSFQPEGRFVTTQRLADGSNGIIFA